MNPRQGRFSSSPPTCHRRRWISLGGLTLASVFATSVSPAGDTAPSPPGHFSAPPPAPPTVERALPAFSSPLRPAAVSPYTIGDPTDEEQLYLEFINRARAEPQAEVQRYLDGSDSDVEGALDFFEVDRGVLLSQFAGIAPAAPVSLHPQLTSASRLHSQDMFENMFQGHVSSDGRTTSSQRVDATGYSWTALAENVYARAKSVWHGHAGFEVDWGNGPSGIQDPPGHRNTIHNALFREVGIGVILGRNGDVGPQLVTQVFANRPGLTPFVTGVVYYDLNGNQFYDLGEGIGGVTVKIAGINDYAVTARSGGYSVPTPGNGSYQVTFSVPGLADITKPATVANGANVKVDHTPAYAPPTLGGTTVAFVGRANPYLISPVGGATAYESQSFRRLPWSSPDGAESGLGRFVADTSPGYDIVSTGVRNSGAASFHLAHPQPARTQYLTVQNPIRLGAASELQFFSRLRLAAPPQVARAQISLDQGSTWEDLWNQPGTGDSGDTTFREQRISLAPYAGRVAAFRFAYTFTSGSFFPQTSDQVGWFLDDIQVTDAEELEEAPGLTTVSGGTLDFRPLELGLYLLQARALIGDRTFPWGNPLPVTTQDGGPVEPQVRLTSQLADNGATLQIAITLEQGVVSSLSVESAPTPTGPWTTDASATIEPAASPDRFLARVSLAAETARFFRVLATTP